MKILVRTKTKPTSLYLQKIIFSIFYCVCISVSKLFEPVERENKGTSGLLVNYNIVELLYRLTIN